MEILYPDLDGFSGVYLAGYRQSPGGGGAEQVGCVVLKRSYRIQAGALVPEAGEIWLADQVREEEIDGDPVSLVTRESDLALFKPEADLVVQGFRGGGDPEGSARVDGALWLSRAAGSAAAAPEDFDAQDHLFGWEPRYYTVRRNAAGAHPIVPVVPPALAGFDNTFFNAYRRRFKSAAGFAGPFPYFDGGEEVAVERDGTDPVSFRLGEEAPRATLHYWCSGGPDKQAYWCPWDLDVFNSDTVVVEPDTNRAHRVWRGVWPLEESGSPPVSAYRRLTITLAEA